MSTDITNTPHVLPAKRPRRDHAAIVLPELTPEVIKRAIEGLAAGRDPKARQGVRATLANVDRIADGLPDQRWSGTSRRTLLRALTHTLFEITVEHPENIPTEPAMLAPNHLSHFDPFVVLGEMPASPYYYVLGDARTMYNHAWKRLFVARTGGVIPLDRLWKEEMAVIAGAKAGRADLDDLAASLKSDVPDGGSIEALRQIDRIIQGIFNRGDALLVFPEGGLGLDEGRLRLPLKRGTIIYAMRAGVPIVPVGLIGTREVYLRKRITVRFGPPLRFAQSSRPRPAEIEDAIDQLTAAMQALLPDHYELPPGPKLLRRQLNHMLW